MTSYMTGGKPLHSNLKSECERFDIVLCSSRDTIASYANYSYLLLTQSHTNLRLRENHPDHHPTMSDVHLPDFAAAHPEWRFNRIGCDSYRVGNGLLELAGRGCPQSAGLFWG